MPNFTLWILCSTLCVIGSLGYNISNKLAPSDLSPFVFAGIMTLVSGIILGGILIYAAANTDHSLVIPPSIHYWWPPILAGVSVALIDVCYFLALRYGSIIDSQLFWTVGGTMLVLIFSTLFLKESITISKVAGLVLGLFSVFLMIKK